METVVPVLLVGATALHLGFQLVVTALVYPVLLAPTGGPGQPAGDRWDAEHAAHRRRITPVVGLVYGALAVACGAELALGTRTPAALVAVGVVAAVVVLTAVVAAPAHGRLARDGWSAPLVRRLRRADAVRLLGAAVAVVAAGAAALGPATG